MRPRFAALLAPPGIIRDALKARLAAFARAKGLAFALERPSLIVAVQGEQRRLTDAGLVVGALFGTSPVGPARIWNEAEQARLAASRGSALIDSCWGGYVALLADPGGAGSSSSNAPPGATGSTQRFRRAICSGRCLPARCRWNALSDSNNAPPLDPNRQPESYRASPTRHSARLGQEKRR